MNNLSWPPGHGNFIFLRGEEEHPSSSPKIYKSTFVPLSSFIFAAFYEAHGFLEGAGPIRSSQGQFQ
jgi:hypothetical protein